MIVLLVSFICLSQILTYCHAQTVIQVPRSHIDYRLSDDVFPSNYNIEIKPYLYEDEEAGKHRFTFDGIVQITLAAQMENVRRILLHSKELYIEAAYLRTVDGLDVPLNLVEYISERDKIAISLQNADQTLEYGEMYVLVLHYSGVLSDDMRGFFKSKYYDNGAEKYIAATQFQTTHARRAFPCFDEPRFRTTFDITINSDQRFKTVRSNTKLKETEIIESRVKYTFETTPVMPTYLVAFLVSDFEIRSNGKPVPLSIIAQKAFYNQTKYSLEVGEASLDKLNEFTGFPYENMGLGKMDLAAIPDFSPNGMENWGLLKFKESRIFYDERYSQAASKQYIVELIAHEQAHMWFGDYVTCKWWSYAWLNEGFARYIQYMVAQQIEETWEMDKQFVVERLHTSLVKDSEDNAHPLTNLNVASPSEISKMFDAITYDKGASIIRMIEHIMEPKKFQLAIRKYLEKNRSVEPADLLSALKTQWNTDKSVNLDRIFKDFTEQSGYPLLTFKLSADKKIISITQEPFHLSNSTVTSTQRWETPISYTTNIESNFNSTAPQVYFDRTLPKVVVELSPVDWVIANIQNVGYYRVDYDDDNWKRILEALKMDQHSNIHELNRAQIVDDLLNFARAGRKP